jgi:hypothetical protein
MPKAPKITVTRDGRNFKAQCPDCSYSLSKGDKALAVQRVWGHMVGRHEYPISPVYDVKIDDQS